jgi:hypothetical protein
MLILRKPWSLAEGILHLRDGVIQGIVVYGFWIQCGEALDALHTPVHSLLLSHDKFIYVWVGEE